MTTDATQELDLFDLLKNKVASGEPIYFNGPMEGAVFAMHVATVARIGKETGKAVTVVYAPNLSN